MQHSERCRSSRLVVAVAGIVIGMCSVGAYNAWSKTSSMPVEQALELVGDDLSPEYRQLVAAALHRNLVSIVQALQLLEERPGELAAHEASSALEHARRMLR